MSKALSCGILGLALLSSALNAQEQRWFEIELLIFSQTPSSELQETFGHTVTPIKPGRAYDLLSPRYQPNITNLLAALPLCDSAATLQLEYRLVATMPKQLCIIETQPHSWQQRSLFEPRYTNNTLPYPANIGPQITGSGQHQNQLYLAEQSSLQLNELANKIKRQTGTAVLLHTSWRQAPVTERRAIASHWFSGKNFSQQFDYWGQKKLNAVTQPHAPVSPAPYSTDSANFNSSIKPATEVISNIEQLLQQLNANNQLPESSASALESISNGDSLAISNLPDQVWQLDGLFKLHLDHYLFVNTEFNLRVPSDDSLHTIYVRQSRRVISGEIHYLDHPYLGIVLQIRRYEPPLTPNNDEISPIP